MDVSEAVASRRSIRAFLDKPVDMDLLRDLIARAGRAPSGGNLQPWHIHIVSGDSMLRLKSLMRARLETAPAPDVPEYSVYPQPLGEPYRGRRDNLGDAMYAPLGISREDKAARMQFFAANWQFFNAPVGLFCSVRRDHGAPQWGDCGMYLQTLMLLLREAGLDSCAQESWTAYHSIVTPFLNLPPERMLFTGMAIGYRDPEAAVNQFEVPRAPMDEWAEFLS